MVSQLLERALEKDWSAVTPTVTLSKVLTAVTRRNH
jgi:hypothetical protein